ncbi:MULTISPECIES: glucose PTS transporter subunit EIIB [Erwinia]|uniref:PTS sugar transporter n=2 Tax=Erwinia TaxID=551 RepID=A0A014N5H1_9GAMM|nr:glucose PTS transporter subunit EIIB [Erwinia mallotivora]EXU74638.1 PTS sugar transporter [Erwinia mallotivora]
MVSLKSFRHYIDQPAATVSSADEELLDQLLCCFGGRDNIQRVDACLTRLRVTVKSLALVDSDGLQQAGAIGVVILGQEVHAIFGLASDSLRQLLEARFFQGNKKG